MALVEEKYTESTDGIKKTIDKGSMGMALDILQRGLYAHPIESTIRELASNCYDAIKEREVAKSIILKNSDISDHFDVTKSNGIFHASGWDPSYFDLSWLSDDPYVYLYYDEGTQKDTLRVVDHGVGLGKTRLVNYFMLNWSSKRTNKDSLGRWGLGSKVALSLGVESFRVITYYNGKKFKFDVFLDKVESIISKFNSKGDANEPFILVDEKHVTEEDGSITTVPAYVAYCESTTEKNGVEIQIEVKKHNKDLFFEAVTSQLMYMPNIKFLYKKLLHATYEEIPIAAKILYKDDNVIISESTVYDKPHILLGTGNALINYGFVSFRDLELEPKRGSVGLIMDINDIEVTPSRESPIWSAKTRAAVLEKYNMVTKMASAYLNNELSSETDYIKWLSKASQVIGSIRSGGNNTSVLSRLASIIDLDSIENVTFPLDKEIIFDTTPKTMFGNSLTVRSICYNSFDRKVIRKNIDSLSALSYPIYFTKIGSNPYKDRYLYEESNIFILINIKENADIDKLGALVLESKALLDYDSIVVPDDRMELYLSDSQEVSEDDGDTLVKAAPKVDYSASRKINKQIVLHKLTGVGSTYDYKFTSYDVYISQLFSTCSNYLTVYTTGGDRETLSDLLAIFPKHLLSISAKSDFDSFKTDYPLESFILSTPITGVLIAQENVKYIESSSKYISMTDFVLKTYDNKNEKVIFSDIIKSVATLSVISSLLVEKFSNNISYLQSINMNLVSKKLQSLASFHKQHFDSYYRKAPKDIMKSCGFLHDAVLLQLYKNKILEASDEVIEDLKNSLNNEIPDYLCDNIDMISDTDIVDLHTIRSIIKLIDYYAPHIGILIAFCEMSSYQEEEVKKVASDLIEYFKFTNNMLL